MQANFKNYYNILEIPQDATAIDIEKAYQKLSAAWHPDRHKNNRREAEYKFHDISEAYETLSNRNRRTHYDELLSKQYSI
jgi:molecular chaperone DnaJ